MSANTQLSVISINFYVKSRVIMPLSTFRLTLWYGWWITDATCIRQWRFMWWYTFHCFRRASSYSYDILVWYIEPSIGVCSQLFTEDEAVLEETFWYRDESIGRNDFGVKNTLKVCVTIFRNWLLLLKCYITGVGNYVEEIIQIILNDMDKTEN